MTRDTLDQILRDPSRISEFPQEAIPAVMAQCAALQSALAARMLSTDNEREGQRPEASNEKLLTVPDVAAQLKVPDSRVYSLVRRGELDSTRVGKYIRIPVGAIQEYLARQSQEPLETGLNQRYSLGRDRPRTEKVPKTARSHSEKTSRANRSHRNNRRKVGKRRTGNLGARLTFPQATGEDGEG